MKIGELLDAVDPIAWEFLAVPIRESAQLKMSAAVQVTERWLAARSIYRAHYAAAGFFRQPKPGVYWITGEEVEEAPKEIKRSPLYDLAEAALGAQDWYSLGPLDLRGRIAWCWVGHLLYHLARQGVAVDPYKVMESLKAMGPVHIQFACVRLGHGVPVVLLAAPGYLAAIAGLNIHDAEPNAPDPLGFLRTEPEHGESGPAS
jgi:hypothetical protein